jgi:hypothetical protein
MSHQQTRCGTLRCLLLHLLVQHRDGRCQALLRRLQFAVPLRGVLGQRQRCERLLPGLAPQPAC